MATSGTESTKHATIIPFRKTLFRSRKVAITDLEQRIRDGACRGVAVVACSEMGVNLPLIADAPDTFVWQNLGNCIANSRLDLFIAQGKVTDVVVYGHWPCQFLMTAVQVNENRSDIFSDVTMRYFDEEAGALKTFVEDSYRESTGSIVMRRAAEQHILSQLLKVRSAVETQSRAKQVVHYHGWLWMHEKGKLLHCDFSRLDMSLNDDSRC